MRKYKILYTLSLTALLALFLIGCHGGGASPEPPSPKEGTVGVHLTDAPACGFEAVNVTVGKVRIHTSASATENDAGWYDITLNPARKINLLNLTNGTLESLGETPLPAGHYTQLRLVLAGNTGSSVANSIVLSGTTAEIELATPSAVQSGIKLINEFDVAAGQRVDLVLDFDACKSIVTRGNGSYGLKPVIKVMPFVLNGIDGFVETSLLGSNVMVSAQVNGTIVNSTVPNALTGEFFLARLDAPGNYDVIITADGHATAIIAGVPISSATSTATVSTSAAPITLMTSTTGNISGTALLNPADTDEISYVTAKQTFTAGPMVTVKSQGVDLVSGVYSLTVPVAAPFLGNYGTGILPIALTEQPAAAGKYAVEAAASSYQTQTVNVDIATTDSIQNFLLTP